jgi:hypothetical protein
MACQLALHVLSALSWQLIACPVGFAMHVPSAVSSLHVLSASQCMSRQWSAPHFLVHLKWEFVNRSYIRNQDYIMTRWPVLLSSQDELNSLGVA